MSQSAQLPDHGSSEAVKPDSPRKLQLVAVASSLFQEHGFHKVSMEDIAKAVGLRGPALYRHFRSKQELLARVVLDQITVCLDVAERAAALDGSPEERLEQYVDELSRLVLERNEVMLWRWERRHLGPDDQVQFRQSARRLEERTTEVLASVRTDLDGGQLEFLSWAFLSSFAHARGIRSGLDSAGDRPRAAALLARMATCVAKSDIGKISGEDGHAEKSYVPTGRRERILETATRLFNDRGYFAVSIEDIASESDTAIATIYQYFESKASLLYTILDRGVEGVNYMSAHLLSGHLGDQEIVDRLVANYVDLSMGPHGRLFRIFDEELMTLPESQRSELLLVQRGHIDEWVGALQRLKPEFTVSEARARARTATGVAADIAQTARLRDRPATRKALLVILAAIVSG